MSPMPSPRDGWSACLRIGRRLSRASIFIIRAGGSNRRPSLWWSRRYAGGAEAGCSGALHPLEDLRQIVGPGAAFPRHPALADQGVPLGGDGQRLGEFGIVAAPGHGALADIDLVQAGNAALVE